MAVIFMDGFDSYQTADILKRWSALVGAPVISSASARGGVGQGLQLPPGNSGNTLTKAFGVNYAKIVFGIAAYVPGVQSRGLCYVCDGATEQFHVGTSATGVLEIRQGATLKATGTTVLSTGWHYIEVKATVHGSAGVVEVKLDGGAEIASTGSLDLTGTANNYWNTFGWPGNYTNSVQCDDIYVIDPDTGSNTTFLGPVRIGMLLPAGAGNYAQWTPNGGSNMGNVSEPAEDGDNSFNQSSTANQVDTFVMQDLPAASGSVLAVQHLITARQDTGAARTIASVTRISGTDYAGTAQALTSSYSTLVQVYDVSPATSAAWSIGAVNGLEAGYKLVS
jgi:hypothetical protein